MKLILAILSSMGIIAAAYVSYVLKELSWKLGSVTKMPPYYRAFYLMGGLLSVAIFARTLKASLLLVSPEFVPMPLNSASFYVAAYHIPLFLGMLVGLWATLKYWKWLLEER